MTLRIWSVTAATLALLAGGFNAMRTGGEAQASVTATASPAAWALDGTQMAEPPARDAVLTALAEETSWMLVNRLTDASCRFTRRGPNVWLNEGCTDAMKAAHRVRAWRVDAGEDGTRVTMVDELGSQVMEFAWDDETGLTNTTGQWRALALLPVSTAGDG